MATLRVQNWPRRRGEILLKTASGFGEKATAKELGLALQSVKNQRSAILYHLNAKNMPEAISKAFERGILQYIPALVMAILTALPSVAPVSADDEPVVRRIRPHRGGRRLSRETIPSDPHALIWDDGEFIIQRTQVAS